MHLRIGKSFPKMTRPSVDNNNAQNNPQSIVGNEALNDGGL